MTKKIYIILICIFGFIFTPTVILACGSKPESEKSCCKKENKKETDTKDCCKNKKHHSQDKDDCGGKCSDKSCQCPTSNFSLTLPFYSENNNSVFYFSDEKHKFCHVEMHLSSGFYSIWIPPNIG